MWLNSVKTKLAILMSNLQATLYKKLYLFPLENCVWFKHVSLNYFSDPHDLNKTDLEISFKKFNHWLE